MVKALSTLFNRSTAPSQSQNSRNVPASVMVPRLMVGCSVVALIAIGLVMVYSAGSIKGIDEQGDAAYYLIRQLVWVVVGGALCFGFSRLDYHVWLGRANSIFFGVCMLMLLATFLFGVVGLGAKRWLDLGFVSLQPSEFAKIAFMLMGARIMHGYQHNQYSTIKAAGMMIGLVIVPLLFLFWTQSDLGTTAICLFGLYVLLWMAEVNWKIMLAVAVIVIFFALAATFLVSYRSDRLAFVDPWADPYGNGYQLIHSLYAFAQGGLFGKGLGNSAEKYLYLPESQTDFVFSVWAEETGLLGTLFVVALFLVFLLGGLKVAQAAPDHLGQMIVTSLVAMLVFQAFLNMGCVMSIFPTTGKPLPFLSYGGSSMFSSLIMVGIIWSVSRCSDDSEVYRQRRDDLQLITSDRRRSSADVAESGRVPERSPERGGSSRKRSSFGFGGRGIADRGTSRFDMRDAADRGARGVSGFGGNSGRLELAGQSASSRESRKGDRMGFSTSRRSSLQEKRGR